jgi:hypothetical protein
MLLVHHAIRRLMHQAALDHQLDPDRLSFVRSLRIVRRQVTTTGQAALSPLSRKPGRWRGSPAGSPSGCCPPAGCVPSPAW